jgi:probable rRNA maturation factor
MRSLQNVKKLSEFLHIISFFATFKQPTTVLGFIYRPGLRLSATTMSQKIEGKFIKCYDAVAGQTMIKHEISVYIETKLITSIKKTWFKSIIHQILDALNIKTPAELGLVITNDETIQQLNKAYRNKDGPTDVLAFYMLPQQVPKKGTVFVVPPDGISHLGEIVISHSQAIYQAEEAGHDIKHELSILLIHGVLHLLGYDHEGSGEAQAMKAKEEEILAKLNPLNN